MSEELEAALAREADLRSSLVEAHRQRLESEDRLADRLTAAQAEALELREELERRKELLVIERVRRQRLERSIPVRALKHVRDLPGLGWIQARRTRGYDRALAAARASWPEADR